MKACRIIWRSGGWFFLAAAVLGACGGSDATNLFDAPPGTGATTGNEAGSAAQAGEGGLNQGGTVSTGSGGTGLAASGGSSAGTGSNQGGSAGDDAASGGGGAAGSGGEGGVIDPCAGPEYCDGRDNDCDEVIDGEGICPADCVGLQREGRGYMFCDIELSGADAKAACEAEDSRLGLLMLESAEEETWVLDQLDEQNINNPIWIGATDAAVEGEWRWGSGALFFMDDEEGGMAVGGAYENWEFNQPNDSDGSEDCAILVPSSEGWNDTECDESWIEFTFVCEARY